MRYLLFYERRSGEVFQTVAIASVGDRHRIPENRIATFQPPGLDAERVGTLEWEGDLVSGTRLFVDPETQHVTRRAIDTTPDSVPEHGMSAPQEVPAPCGGGSGEGSRPTASADWTGVASSGAVASGLGAVDAFGLFSVATSFTLTDDPEPGDDEIPSEHEDDPIHAYPGFEVKRPLILVPGIMGSDLYQRIPRKPLGRIWPPINNRGQIMSPLILISGGNRFTPKAGSLFRFAYDGLIRALEAMGYVENDTLFFFPYDWTDTCNRNGWRLNRFIRRIANQSKDNKVDVINHSMGGIVTRAAIQLHGALPFVARTVYIASPHYGAPQAYFAIHPSVPGGLLDSGWIELAANLTLILAFAVPFVDQLKQVTANLKSVYDLLPDKYYFRRHHIVDKRLNGAIVPVSPELLTYTTDPHSAFPTAQMRIQAKRAMRFKASLAPTPPEAHRMIFCSSLPTNDRVLFDADSKIRIPIGGPMLFATIPTPHFHAPGTFAPLQNGDGTVPSYSGEAGEARLQVTDTHKGLPNNPLTHAEIAAFLGGP